MFTGIIEDIGKVTSLTTNGTNLDISIKSNITHELKIDQSVSHNGVCLTVVAIQENLYIVTAIKETLEKSNLGSLQVGSPINLERAMKLGDRLDGHLVQGHVDQTAICVSVQEVQGSWYFTFTYNTSFGNVTIEKGSITVNGVSLTVVNSEKDRFSVAIIPYTYSHTNFYTIKKGDTVNIEFDLVGKYLKRFLMK
ncbi:MAG: riboflavin synthase [Bacteroidetes bacterium HGW-Bacteroidetes-2]|jgi:riboflavin synthase|nr:MAG: riboflavin synthase [Bacteroidetes bacterium HGW-Bacteroidetes-2]